MNMTTYAEWMQTMEMLYGPKPAFRYREGGNIREVTYAQYTADIRRYITYLRSEIPDVKGKHIGLLARNSYQYAVCLFGTMVAGAVAVPLNVEESWDNIDYEIDFSDICCLFHDGEYLEKEPKLSEKYGNILRNLTSFEQFRVEWQDIELQEERVDMDVFETDRPVLLLFTSGTTGRSKGVLLSEKNCFAPMTYFLKVCQANNGQDPRVFFVIPMYHISGLSGILTWTCLGCCLNLCNSLKYIYRDLAAMPSDHVSVVPMVLKLWYKDICRGRRDRLGDLKFITCGGAAVDTEMFEAFQRAGIQVQQGYGLTEVFGGGSTNSSSDPAKSASVGVPSPTCQLKIIDGEICIKSESIMLGYYHDPKATAAIIRDGWLYTGDLGYLDEDGFLYLTGRKKNLIILSGGENVSPEELEKKLSQIPEIAEVMVVQKDDVICAQIFPQYDHVDVKKPHYKNVPVSDEDEVQEEQKLTKKEIMNEQESVGRIIGEKSGEKKEAERKNIQRRIEEAVAQLNVTLPTFKQIRSIEYREEPFEKTATGKFLRY